MHHLPHVYVPCACERQPRDVWAVNVMLATLMLLVLAAVQLQLQYTRRTAGDRRVAGGVVGGKQLLWVSVHAGVASGCQTYPQTGAPYHY
eukprot:364214-Rhodomonas_salina.3